MFLIFRLIQGDIKSNWLKLARAPAGSACGNVLCICARMSRPRVVLWMAIFSLGRIKAATVCVVVAFSSP